MPRIPSALPVNIENGLVQSFTPAPHKHNHLCPMEMMKFAFGKAHAVGIEKKNDGKCAVRIRLS